jgi:hypothetical protein
MSRRSPGHWSPQGMAAMVTQLGEELPDREAEAEITANLLDERAVLIEERQDRQRANKQKQRDRRQAQRDAARAGQCARKAT